MIRSARRPLLVGVVVLLVAAVAVVAWVRLRDDGPDTRLAAAMELAPADAVRFSWTDWAAVRERLDSDVSADTGAEDLQDFQDAAFDADLSAMSALGASTPVLQEKYGVSPASLEWELFAQGETGAVLLMGLPEDLDLDLLRERLDQLGYTAPDAEDGVWDGGVDLLTGIGTLTPELAYLRIDAEARVLLASDQKVSLTDLPGHQRRDDDVAAADSADGSAGGISTVVAGLGEVDAAAVYAGDYACAALAMTQADGADQAAAAGLIEDAGEVDAYDAFGIGIRAADGSAAPDAAPDLRVAMAFETEEQARRNADSRQALAAGPAPGQGGTFADRFALGPVVAEGRLLTLGLAAVRRTFVLSDLSTGPVLFATC